MLPGACSSSGHDAPAAADAASDTDASDAAAGDASASGEAGPDASATDAGGGSDGSPGPDATGADATAEGGRDATVDSPSPAADAGSDTGAAPPDAAPDANPWAALDDAIRRAVAYADAVNDAPALQGGLHYLYRRYGIPEFADAVALYDAATKTAGDRVYRRIVVRATVPSPADLAALTDVDIITAPALYCDLYPPSATFADTLAAARASGGYDLTHAQLALQWLDENGCADPTPAGFRDGVLADMRALYSPQGPMSDIILEAEALFHIVGRLDLTHPGFVDRLVAVQHADGGWSPSGFAGDPSHWHTTGLALWILTSARHPEAPPTPLLDPG